MAKTLRRLVKFTVVSAIAAVVGLLTTVPSSADVTPFVVGGTRATISEYPWTVYLASTSGSQFCGGTLVKGNKVVTAAHCVSGRSAASTRVVWGREDKQSTAGIVASVTRIWVHPSYTSASSGSDVAVLTLDRSISAAPPPTATATRAIPAPSAILRGRLLAIVNPI